MRIPSRERKRHGSGRPTAAAARQPGRPHLVAAVAAGAVVGLSLVLAPAVALVESALLAVLMVEAGAWRASAIVMWLVPAGLVAAGLATWGSPVAGDLGRMVAIAILMLGIDGRLRRRHDDGAQVAAPGGASGREAASHPKHPDPRRSSGLDPASWTPALAWSVLTAITSLLITAAVVPTHVQGLSIWVALAMPAIGVVLGRGRGSTWPATASWVVVLLAWNIGLVLHLLPPQCVVVSTAWLAVFALELPPTAHWERLANALLSHGGSH